jgi:hypothetical protein
MRIEITLMPVDIAKAYFEILRLRKAVRKAELAFRISFARPPSRPRHSLRTAAAIVPTPTRLVNPARAKIDSGPDLIGQTSWRGHKPERAFTMQPNPSRFPR